LVFTTIADHFISFSTIIIINCHSGGVKALLASSMPSYTIVTRRYRIFLVPL
jgi:hypothetical protein